MGLDHRLHGYECFREVYLGLSEGFSEKYYERSPQNLLNPAYTSQVDTGGEFLDHEELKKRGFFYIPTQLIVGEITLEEDVNLIDSFNITLIANFWQANKIIVKNGKGVKVHDFEKNSVPFFPLMDSNMLGTLKAKIKCGYVGNPDKSKIMEGACIGVSPSFRSDGLPVVTLTFRDLSWQMGRYQVNCTYPIFSKNQQLEVAPVNKGYTNPSNTTKSKVPTLSNTETTPNGVNFTFDEFLCKDIAQTAPPQKYWGNLQTLMDNLDIIREYLGVGLFINSGFRTEAHNSSPAVRGAVDSMHLVAGAGDLSSPDATPLQIKLAIDTLIAAKKIKNGGVKMYSTFVHYDIGSTRRW